MYSAAFEFLDTFPANHLKFLKLAKNTRKSKFLICIHIEWRKLGQNYNMFGRVLLLEAYTGKGISAGIFFRHEFHRSKYHLGNFPEKTFFN